MAPSSASSSEARDETPAKSVINGTAADDILDGTEEADRIYAAEDADPQGVDMLDCSLGDDRLYGDAAAHVHRRAGDHECIARGAAGFKLVLAGTGIEETWADRAPMCSTARAR